MLSIFGYGGYVPAPGGEPLAAVTWQPLDERWYTSFVASSEAGIYVSPDRLWECGTILAAVRFLAQSVAMCTPQAFIRLTDQRKPDPGYAVEQLMRKPCRWMTGYRWRMQQLTWAATYGNSYSRLNGWDYLEPLHPDRVTVVGQDSEGAVLYEDRPPRGEKRRIHQDQMLHLRGVSSDSIEGIRMHAVIRQAVGIALAAEKHAASFLRNGARVSGVLEAPGVLEPTVATRMKESWMEAHSGPANAGKTALLQGGTKYSPTTMDHDKAQFLETRDFQVGEILRFLGVPGVVVGYAEKTATYASAKEFFESGGIKHCILPWLMNLEAEVQDSLIPEGDPHFIRFNLDVLMRASLTERYNALNKAIGRPWMTVNEGRRTEDLPPDGDPESDQIADKAAPVGDPVKDSVPDPMKK